MSSTRKAAKKRKTILRIVIIVALAAAALTVGVLILRDRVTEKYGDTADEAETATVTVGSISTTVSGSGNLADEDVETLALYGTVAIDEILVEAGDTVTAGDPVATVDTSTVQKAMADLQEQIDAKDDEIHDAADDAVDSRIKTAVAGRIKELYVTQDDDVASAMYENGALALLSLDGYMSVDVTTTALKAGDAVWVEGSDGTRYAGSVHSAAGQSATIFVSDNGPKQNDAVTIYSESESMIGSGTLTVHAPLCITGYTGTISRVYVTENQQVRAGTALFLLTDTGYSADYDALLSERQTLEEDLQALIALYQEGGLCAPISGSVSTVDATSGDASDSTDARTVLTICPDKRMTISVSVDESDILSLSVGQTAEVTVDSLGDDTFEGTLTSIDTTGTSASGVTQYTAIITLDKAEHMLSGMSATIAIRIEGVENALLIPSDALTQTSAASYVYTSFDSESGELGGMIEVTTGLNNGSYVEITDGLSEGDVVYYMKVEDNSSSFTFGGMGGMGGSSSTGGTMPSGGSAPSDFGGERPSGGRSDG